MTMRADILIAGGIDYPSGLRRFLNDAELYELVLRELLLSDTAFERACAAYARGDLAGLEAASHELKGACGNADITGVYQAAAALVDLLRQGEPDPEGVDRAFSRLQTAYLKARAAIEQAGV